MLFALAIFSFIFGTIIGSFLNVLIYRLPKEESIGGHSYCPVCKHQLGPLDLFPIFSWLFLRGKCRYCRAPISKRYIGVEIITGELFALAFLLMLPMSGVQLFLFFRVLFVIAVLLVVFAIDLEYFLILDSLIFPATIILLFFNLGADILLASTYGTSLVFSGVIAALGLALFFFGIYSISGGKWIGFGDVKFSFFLGLATPGWLVFINVFLAYAIGAVLGIFLLVFGYKKLNSRIPFGTLLALSTMITLLKGPEILRWYMHLIGVKY